jgi:predicted DCC family thiol-disulfide oxidoreductase YuxK
MPIDLVFYDGNCGFCHWSVQFLIYQDRNGRRFRFAPLGGDTFRAVIPEADRALLPDSVVVRTTSGTILSRSAAVVHVLRRLGGWWLLLGAILWPIPAPIRDALYNGFASVRYRLFRRPKASCPLLPPHLRRRFDP